MTKIEKMRMMRKWVFFKNEIFPFLFGLISLVVIGFGLYQFGKWATYWGKYCYHAYILDDLHRGLCNSEEKISRGFVFCENGQHGWIRTSDHHERLVLKDVSWVAGIDSEDSILCFASKGYRGFLNRNNCQVTIPADRYVRAWQFSEGYAAVVEEDSTLKFINLDGKVVLNKGLRLYSLPTSHGFLFKNGFCQMMASNNRWGLINKQGLWVILPEYDEILHTNKNCWIIVKNGKKGLLNDSLRIVLEPAFHNVCVTDEGVEVTQTDYVMQLLDMQGKILEPFLCSSIHQLYYPTKVIDEELNEFELELSPYKAYQTTSSPSRMGLLRPDGQPLTPPIYTSIEAVNEEIFKCEINDDTHSSVFINKKGQVIK